MSQPLTVSLYLKYNSPSLNFPEATFPNLLPNLEAILSESFKELVPEKILTKLIVYNY